MEKVIVYSTKTCPWCFRVKDFLKEHKVKFEEVDVGADRVAAAKMVEMSGESGVPQIQIGDLIIVGFNEPALREHLKLK